MIMTRIDFKERGKLIADLSAEQKRIGQMLSKSASEDHMVHFTAGAEEPIFKGGRKKEITDRKGKVFFKVDYSPSSDVIAIYFSEGLLLEISHYEDAEAFYNFDIKGNLKRIDLPQASTQFDMRNEHLLPLNRGDEGTIDIRYDKEMDVLYIKFGKKTPASSEAHPDMNGVVRDYDKGGKVIGYAIVAFSKSFYRGREELPELFVEINNEKK
jgi:uncharacterized protein YuzE